MVSVMKKFCVVLSLIILMTFCVGPAVLYAEAAAVPAAAEEYVNPAEPGSGEETIEEILQITAAVTENGTVDISWEAVSADATYAVMCSDKEDGTYNSIGLVTGVIGSTVYNDTALKPAEIRYYKVARLENGIAVKESDAVSVKMPLASPVSVRTTLVESKYVKVDWSKVVGATGYKVYRSLSKNGTYTYLKTVSGTTYTDKTVYAAQGFYYKVVAYKAGSDDVQSESSAAAAYYMKPAVPKASAKNNNGVITVSWKKVTRAQTYYIYRKNSKGTYEKIGETQKLSYTDKKAAKNDFVYYKVCAAYKQDNKSIAGNQSATVKILSRYVNPKKKMVALTFDDGPSKYTKAIVDCLFKYDSAATFFVVGNRVNNYKSVVKHTYSRGCELGNHSYSHPLLTKQSSKKIKSQVKKTDDRIKAITGQKTVLIRVPYGGYNKTVKKSVGKPMIQWSDDTMDWKTRSKKKTVNYVMKHVKDGDIILMHDIHKPTKEAALELIPKLKAKGYQIVTVSELAKYKGYKLKKGKVYSSFR